MELVEDERKFVLERLGKRCAVCGKVIYTQSELSVRSCDAVHVQCENVGKAVRSWRE